MVLEVCILLYMSSCNLLMIKSHVRSEKCRRLDIKCSISTPAWLKKIPPQVNNHVMFFFLQPQLSVILIFIGMCWSVCVKTKMNRALIDVRGADNQLHTISAQCHNVELCVKLISCSV